MKAAPVVLSCLFLTFCDSQQPVGTIPIPADPDPEITAVVAFPDLSFRRPVDLQEPDDQTGRLFVVEQEGIISVFPRAGAPTKKTFLNITVRVKDAGNEEGLLGLAFHPQYKTNGFFYVNYTASNPNRTVVSRFKVSADPDVADDASEVVILTFGQPYSNHNGGQLAFGPDGYLYIAIGDGGSGGDPQNHGQDLTGILGSIARIDVNTTSGTLNYSIPADNPFKSNTFGYREEIYAFGLRNPWRMSFDAETGVLWAADVGQNSYEEIDIITKGGNYGWKIMEGKHCFLSNCDEGTLQQPIWEYPRTEGVSITGGFVYRGALLPSLKGKYIYADYGSQRIWALDFSNQLNPVNRELLTASFAIASFGVDKNNELYLCGFDGKIHRLEEVN